MEDKYVFFWGGILSNFYPCTFVIDDIKFSSSEQAFMLFKACEFSDEQTALQIMQTNNPAKCKKLGRGVVGFNQDHWRYVGVQYMEEACLAKFSQNTELLEYLRSTGDKILVEASQWDKYWGIGLGADNPLRFREDLWPGENKLGIVLMAVRDKLCKN